MLRVRDCREIVQLVGECRELGDDRLVWREHFVASLARLVDADLGSVGEMQGCRSLKVRDRGVIHWHQPGLVDPAVADAAMTEFRRDPACAPTLLDYLGRNPLNEGLCLSRRQIVDDRDWYASRDYQVIHRPCGLDHILWCFRPIEPGVDGETSSGLILTRASGRPDFSGRERLIIREAHAALVPLIGGPLARFADRSAADLPPRVRQVLTCLLEGDGDKQIAQRLGVSILTVNQYTKVIYRHFRVPGRVGLLSRWVRRGWRHPASVELSERGEIASTAVQFGGSQGV
jgi:DNA-binding CsgD family transcriptional regulator